MGVATNSTHFLHSRWTGPPRTTTAIFSNISSLVIWAWGNHVFCISLPKRSLCQIVRTQLVLNLAHESLNVRDRRLSCRSGTLLDRKGSEQSPAHTTEALLGH